MTCYSIPRLLTVSKSIIRVLDGASMLFCFGEKCMINKGLLCAYGSSFLISKLFAVDYAT